MTVKDIYGIWKRGLPYGRCFPICRNVGPEALADNLDGGDTDKIYRLLEDEIIPLYGKMSENSIPHRWVRLMKESIKSNAAVFSARRRVKQYITKFYWKSIKSGTNTAMDDLGSAFKKAVAEFSKP